MSLRIRITAGKGGIMGSEVGLCITNEIMGARSGIMGLRSGIMGHKGRITEYEVVLWVSEIGLR